MKSGQKQTMSDKMKSVEKRLGATTGGTTWVTLGGMGAFPAPFSAVIPDQHYYRANGSDALLSWTELR